MGLFTQGLARQGVNHPVELLYQREAHGELLRLRQLAQVLSPVRASPAADVALLPVTVYSDGDQLIPM